MVISAVSAAVAGFVRMLHRSSSAEVSQIILFCITTTSGSERIKVRELTAPGTVSKNKAASDCRYARSEAASVVRQHLATILP